MMASDSQPSDSKKDKLVVAFLKNPDPIFFTELDGKLQKQLEEAGVEVVHIDINSISIKMSHQNQVQFFMDKEEL